MNTNGKKNKTPCIPVCCVDLCLCVCVSRTVCLTHGVQFLFQLTHLGQSQAGPGIDAPRVETHVVRVELDRFAEVKIKNQNQIQGDNS